MGVFQLFSKRQKKLRGDVPDVYVYNEMPKYLRIQITHIIKDTLGRGQYDYDRVEEIYAEIHKTLCKEYGRFKLCDHYIETIEEEVLKYFLEATNYEHCLDIIECMFTIFDSGYIEDNEDCFVERCQEPEDAIKELNHRFKEAGVGYQFESGEIIRVDSQILHSEVVKPVLKLFGENRIYEGANAEFLKAHEHYRHKSYKECLAECLKSFESVMIAICEKRSWTYGEKDTSSKLIQVCFDNNLVPPYLQSQFTAIRGLLGSGISTLRNREAGHGQGVEVTDIPEHLASYALHLTATNLLFLVNCEKELP